jgi:ATP-dependent helicase/nuclease subunit A
MNGSHSDPRKARSVASVLEPSSAMHSNNSLAHLFIRASAGTGKTFQLSNRYLQLILLGHSAERILATTFTRKAAGEILGRILIRLAEAATDAERAARLAGEVGLRHLTQDDCQVALHHLTGQLHRLRISTLDSFFLQATQALSLDLGLPPNWRILDETEERPLREAAIAAMLQQNERATVAELLNSLTQGDTDRGITGLLLETVIDMYEIYLESSAKAWHQLPRRTELSADQRQQLVGELVTWAGEFPSDRRLVQAVEGLSHRMQREEWNAIVESRLLQTVVEGDLTFYRKTLPSDLVSLIQTVADHVRAVIQNKVALQTEASHDLLDRFHHQFEALKLERRALRFSDLTRHLRRLEHAAHWAQLSFRLDTTVDSLLLDEFQDTALDQWRVLRPFALHASGVGFERSFLCVGDTKQAIYGWRGGNAELIDAVTTELGSLDERSLDRSFRSAPAVIDVVNRINRQMDRHGDLERYAPAVSRWVERFPVHTTARDQLSGYVSLETTEWASTADDQRELAIRLAAERVAAIRLAAPHTSVAVLVRTNEFVGQMMYALQRLRIPASEEGGNPLTDSAAVQLILSLLTLADHPQDLTARFHLAHSPWASELNLTSYQDSAAAQRLSRQVHRSLANVGYGEVIQAWIGQLEPFSTAREWRRLNQLAELAYRYQQQVEAPRDVGYHQQHVMPVSTAEFIRRVGQQRVSDPTEDLVRVMTVHQSKGLQFDTVILPNLDRKLESHHCRVIVDRPSATEPIETAIRWVEKNQRKLLPDRIQRMHDQHQLQQMHEALCVMYVALTRAVHSLHMIVAPTAPSAGAESASEAAEGGAPCRSRRTKSRSSNKTAKLPVSMAGLIRAALTDGQPLEPRQLVFEHGDPHWRSQSAAETRDVEILARVPPSQVELRPAAALGASAERAVRPSQLEGEGRVRLADRLSLPGQAAMQRGSLIHAFFEQIEWLDKGVPTADELAMIGMSLDTNADYLAAAITDFQQLMTGTTLRAVFSRQYYNHWRDRYAAGDPSSWRLEARREQRLNTRDGDDWLSGSIDRLVLMYCQGRPVAADILDFKTDAVPTASSLGERSQFYRPQLLAYRRGVSRMLRLDAERISARLLFVARGHVVDLTPPA